MNNHNNTEVVEEEIWRQKEALDALFQIFQSYP